MTDFPKAAPSKLKKEEEELGRSNDGRNYQEVVDPAGIYGSAAGAYGKNSGSPAGRTEK